MTNINPIYNFNIILFILFLVFINFLILHYRKTIASRLKIYDLPNERKIHTHATPLIGGLCLFTTLIFSIYFCYFYEFIDLNILLTLSIFYLFFFLIGLWDDIKPLSPRFRTLVILASLIILLSVENNLLVQKLEFKFAKEIVYLKLFSFVFTLFCFFALYNAINFIDGYNGVTISISIYWISILLFKNINLIYFFLLITMVIIFFYNIHGKIFLGNSGTSVLSIFFSTSFIYEYVTDDIIYADEILLLLLFPGIDMIRVTIQRIINNKKIYYPDKSHFHHYLIKKKIKYVWQLMLGFTMFPYIVFILSSNMFVALVASGVSYIATCLYLMNSN